MPGSHWRQRTEGVALLLLALRGREESLGREHPLTVGLRKLVERWEETSGEERRTDPVGAADAPLLTAGESGGEETIALLMHVYIAPAQRRRGAGRQALLATAQAAWRANASLVAAVVAQANLEGVALLKRNGFKMESELIFSGQVHHRFILRQPAVFGYSRGAR